MTAGRGDSRIAPGVRTVGTLAVSRRQRLRLRLRLRQRFARFVSVAAPVIALRASRVIDAGTIRMLTWGGLKGGISVALAMKLPEFPGRNAVLTVSYVIVVFSIIVQGLTIERVLRWLYPAPEENLA